MTKAHVTSFDWTDPLDLRSRLTDEERMISEVARSYAREKLLPRVVSAFAEERFDREIVDEMGELGLLGITLPEEYGGAGASHVAYGLVAREIEAIDSGYRSMMSVQSSLAMHPIHAFGTEEQKRRFLPKMARGELLGCFGLTEADGGSDPAAMRTKARKVDGGYVLDGAKYWISNSPIADVAIVWAKLNGDINGFIVERGFDGFTTQKIGDKLSLRASITGDIGLAGLSFRMRTTCPASAASAVRSPASTKPGTGLAGVPSVQLNSAFTQPGPMFWSGSCSASRWPAANSSKKARRHDDVDRPWFRRRAPWPASPAVACSGCAPQPAWRDRTASGTGR